MKIKVPGGWLNTENLYKSMIDFLSLVPSGGGAKHYVVDCTLVLKTINCMQDMKTQQGFPDAI